MSVNPDLDPSTTYNYETGFKARFSGGHSIDVSLFYITVKDDIIQSLQPNNQTSYSNAGETRKKGVEISGKFQLLDGLFLGGSYTYSDFVFAEFREVIGTNVVDRGGNALPYIPTNQYSLFVFYKHPSGLHCKVTTNTWGSYYVDNANSQTYEGYSRVTDALIGYEKKGFEISLDFQNILNSKYAMEVTRDTSGVTKYRPAAPLTWMFKLGYKF